MSEFEQSKQGEILAFTEKVQAIKGQISQEIIGQQETVDQLLIALIAGGNVLLEGVPGLGKTRLVRTLGRVLQLPFSRIQFTPDLMPADVTGTNVVERTDSGNTFRFHKGPVFASIVLADEINRATPKTQSALLEAMQEHTVTVSGTTYDLPAPYFVLATQNPLEQEGTYPLPEAQLDRFFMKLIVDFPSLEDLHAIVDLTVTQDERRASPVATGEDILRMRALAKQVPIARAVQDYALRLLLATHPEHPDSPDIAKRYVRFGASPRAGQALVAGARILALMAGRYNVSFEDIKTLALSVLRHRMALSFEGMAEGWTCDRVLQQILEALPSR